MESHFRFRESRVHEASVPLADPMLQEVEGQLVSDAALLGGHEGEGVQVHSSTSESSEHGKTKCISDSVVATAGMGDVLEFVEGLEDLVLEGGTVFGLDTGSEEDANVVLVTHSQGVLVGPRELNGPEVLQGQSKVVDVGLGGEEELLYTKKATKCLLQTPATKAKEVESSMQKGRRSTRLANKPKSALSMEQQATSLLMRKCGLLEEKEVMDSTKEAKFRTQFVDPMLGETETKYRDMFGLQNVEGTDGLSAIAIHADA